ncbi:MAG: protein translocase subunit SecD, partial [Pseudomonadota bacterium]
MLQFPLWKTLLTVGLCLAGLVFAAPNLFYETADGSARARAEIERLVGQRQTPPPELIEQAEAWPAWAPPGVVALGLDLRGGAHLLVEVQIAEVVAERMENLRDEIRLALRDAGVRRFTGLTAGAEGATVRITNLEDVETAGRALRQLAQPVGGGIAGGFGMGGIAAGQDLDVRLGTDDQTYIITMTEPAVADLTNRTMAQSLEVMRRRIDETGTREPTIQRQGEDRILIQVPGIGSAAELLELIGRTAKLTFHAVDGFGQDEYSAGPGQIIVPDVDAGPPYLLERRAILTGDNLTDASIGFHPESGLPVVNFRFDTFGSRVFGEFTSANVGQLFATVLDGQVITAPRIQSPILGGAGFIEGNFTTESATQLAILLRSGALPASIKVLEQRTVGPDLGADSIAAGSAATLLAFVAVLVFMMAAYGRFGVFAAIALVLNVAMLMALLSVIGATLTLPGIAGIVLTIGMAVDANVLIFERIREELRGAKGPARAIDKGYSEALSAIIDANITTLIAAVILFAIGSGPVKGFAVTLGLGIITSVFTATMVTRLMVVRWLDWARPKTLKVALLRMVPEKTAVDFLGLRRLTMGFSLSACVGAVVLAAVLGLNFGIDFRGGTMLEIRTEQAADLGEIRTVVTDMDLGDVAVQSFGSERDVLVRVEEQAGDGDDRMIVAEELGQVLQAAFPGTEIRRVEVVGPKVSSELLQAGALAILLAVLA